jgi:hypothetical protein
VRSDLDVLMEMMFRSDCTLTKWERAFVVGCARCQLASRALTEKQWQTLAQIHDRAKYSPSRSRARFCLPKV